MHTLTAFNPQSKEAKRQIASCTGSRPSRKAQHDDFQAPIERHNMMTPKASVESHSFSPFRTDRRKPESAESRVICLNRKTFIFLAFISFLPLYFHAIKYGCNSVGFIFCTFYCFIQMLVNRCVWKDKTNK